MVFRRRCVRSRGSRKGDNDTCSHIGSPLGGRVLPFRAVPHASDFSEHQYKAEHATHWEDCVCTFAHK
ncbi:hypothetical protein M3J07_007177 [Ascochyta lentis]